jgi:glycosyltransferase involved in cell wall biosynthesis
MNIACDARSLVGDHTGVATWLKQVAGGLGRSFGHAITLAASKELPIPPELQLEGVRPLPPPAIQIPGTLWLHSVLPCRLAEVDVEVFVASLGIMPRRCPVPAVVMVHDITPMTHPQHHTLGNRFCFNAYLGESIERASAVVTSTAATEAQLLEHFPFVRGRLHRIGLGVDPFFSPAGADDDGRSTRERFSAGRRFLLHLGTLEPRKGVRHLITAWEGLQSFVDDPPDLVLAGGLGWHTGPILEAVERSAERARIHLPGYLSREDARDLLRHAEVFVLASEAEGFGLPLAEAISCGVPAVASDVPQLREVAGTAALFVPPAEPELLAAAIATALDPDRAGELRRHAAERAPQLRWEPVVGAWNELLLRVVAEG